MKKIIPFVFILIASVSCSEKDPLESCDNFNELAKEMEEVILQIEAKYQGQDLFIKRMRSAQIYWLQYKERHMKMLYPEGYDVTRRTYGEELFNPCKCKELERLFDLRVDELKVFLKGPRKGQEECPTFNNI